MTKAGLIVVLAVLLMAPCVALVARTKVSPAGRETLARQFILPERCLPEPGERKAFLACAVGMPALIFAISLAGRLGSNRWWPNVPRRLNDLTGLVLLGLAAGIGAAGVRNEEYYYLFMNRFYQGPLWSVPLLAMSAAYVWWGRRTQKAVTAVAYTLAAAAILAMFLARIFDEKSAYALHPHFEPIYHPIVQVFLGKTVLVNMASLYGLYPHFLAPIFAVWGLSVLKFSIVMALLVAAVLTIVWDFLAKAAENRALAAIGFLAFVANASFTLFEFNDLYLQYLPIRMLFPAASIWLGLRYLQRPSRGTYWAAMAVLGAGTLWNLDAGIPALGSWVGLLGYRELGEGGVRRGTIRIARHVAAAGLSVGIAMLAYAIAALVRAGRLPDFVSFVAYQKMYYVSGYFMLPMPRLGGWCAVALVYLAGLAYSARALAAGRTTTRASVVFQLSLLGIGLFSYYQGRSHPRVLTLAWWPSVLLLTLFLDELAADWNRPAERLPRWGWAALLLWVLAGSAWSLPWEAGFLKGWYRQHLVTVLQKGQSPIRQEIVRLRRVVRPGERLVTFSRNESLLDARLRLRSEWRCSQIETVLVSDLVDISARIDRGEFDWIYVDISARRPLCPGDRIAAQASRIVNQETIFERTPRGWLIRPRVTTASRPGRAPH